MNRRIFAQGAFSATAATFTLLLTRTPAAFADDWCSSDPLVRVVTPGGSREYVHVTLYALGLEHRRDLRKATVSFTADRVSGDMPTLVTIKATVPKDERGESFPTKMLVSTRTFGKGTVLGQDDIGKAGEAMDVTYHLAVR